MTEPQNVAGLMYQIHELKRQLADAETRGAAQLKAVADVLDVDPEDVEAEMRMLMKRAAEGETRGAVKGLRLAANESDALGRSFSGHALSAFARRIESGEVALP